MLCFAGCFFGSVFFGFSFPPESLALLKFKVCLLLKILSLDLLLCSVIVSQGWQEFLSDESWKSVKHILRFSLLKLKIPANIFFAFENKTANCSAMNFAPATMSAHPSSWLQTNTSLRYVTVDPLRLKTILRKIPSTLISCPLTLIIPGSIQKLA